jgi:dienelactone hydrolase
VPTTFAPESVHVPLLAAAKPELAFDRADDLDWWRAALAARLREIVGVLPSQVDPDIRIEWTAERDGYAETRFAFTAEAGADVPCHLLVPDGANRPVPVVVCLQGHSTGMHNSLARAGVFDPTPKQPAGDRDFALQAVARGYAALVMEQRCFGERADARPAELRQARKGGCHHASHAASLLGRTMVGERTWDVSRAIDVLEGFAEVDASRVACMGNSGGGTISWYAACLDPRIGVVMPSCSICTYRDSIGSIDHCCDNYCLAFCGTSTCPTWPV